MTSKVGTYLEEFFGKHEQIRQNVKRHGVGVKEIKSSEKRVAENNKSDIGFEMMVEVKKRQKI
ncbi:24851_t:CDS:2 [Entrophospora sp. SA101]|nr:24851_t:CDS:2 [Entrophospora sp. SA101]CAJ0861992.1 12027_t:CDS:2 [Entrophospora sp. SA101]